MAKKARDYYKMFPDLKPGQSNLTITTKAIFICDKHGEYTQILSNHSRSGCIKCGYERKGINQKIPDEEWYERFPDLKPGQFNLTSKTKAIFICDKHGEYIQRLGNYRHICPKCSGRILSTNDFIEKSIKVHGNKYDYSKVNYINCHTDVLIICPEHGEFYQNAYKHIHGGNCPKCSLVILSNKKKIPDEEWYERFPDLKPGQTDLTFMTYAIFICNKHGEYIQRLGDSSGCQVCSSSKSEQFIYNYLKINSISFEFQKKFDDCKYKSCLFFDFYLPDYNICIEFDGEFHFKQFFDVDIHHSLDTLQKRDEIKNQYCKDNNIKLLRISYEDRDRIEEILKKELNLC